MEKKYIFKSRFKYGAPESIGNGRSVPSSSITSIRETNYCSIRQTNSVSKMSLQKNYPSFTTRKKYSHLHKIDRNEDLLKDFFEPYTNTQNTEVSRTSEIGSLTKYNSVTNLSLLKEKLKSSRRDQRDTSTILSKFRNHKIKKQEAFKSFHTEANHSIVSDEYGESSQVGLKTNVKH